MSAGGALRTGPARRGPRCRPPPTSRSCSRGSRAPKARPSSSARSSRHGSRDEGPGAARTRSPKAWTRPARARSARPARCPRPVAEGRRTSPRGCRSPAPGSRPDRATKRRSSADQPGPEFPRVPAAPLRSAEEGAVLSRRRRSSALAAGVLGRGMVSLAVRPVLSLPRGLCLGRDAPGPGARPGACDRGRVPTPRVPSVSPLLPSRSPTAPASCSGGP